ncbi:MAG: signal peptide peptidase SppA [Bacteroidota bacterium]
MAFLRNFLAAFIALIVFSLVLFFVVAGIAASASREVIPTVQDKTVLHFPMGGILQERTLDDPLLKAISDTPPAYGLLELIAAIDAAGKDDRIEGILLEPRYLNGGYAAFEEIRNALIDFKRSGKFVYAYGEYVSESDFYMASVADTFLLNPAGALEFNGLSANITFYKGLFDKLEIKPEIFRVGKFKSYVEPYVRTKMSDENRLQYESLLGSMYGKYLENISTDVDRSVNDLANISNLMQVGLPNDALLYGLVTGLGYRDEIITKIRRRLAISESDDVNLMQINRYVDAVTSSGSYSRNRIAVIVAEGDILMGGEEGIVGAAYAKEIRRARDDDRVKAIVLRINSGGGSMTASDLIWRELMLTKGIKPIIASMSSAAASGGYYIAMPADTIVAQPNTITGSIGIFGMWFNLSDFLENKVGITHDVVKTGEFSDIYTVTRPLREVERSIIQRGVDDGYDVFTTKAATARGMSQDELKEIAGGRVWTGAQAHKNGLVDVLGGFEDAVNLAAEAAGFDDDYTLAFYPKQKLFIEKFISRMESSIQSAILGAEMDPIVDEIKELEKLKGLQMRLPGNLQIQ